MAELVITGALLSVNQDAVGFAGLFEFGVRIRIVGIAVGMELHGELAIGALDVLIAGASGHAQNFVIIAFCLCSQINLNLKRHLFFATRTMAGRSRRSLIL